MYSLLEQSSEKLNIDIIHNNPASFESIYNKIIEHPFLNNLKIHQFNNPGVTFPNIEGTHISEATYYRIFIDQYLSLKNEYYVYIDADIICHRDPTLNFTSEIKELKKSGFIISVKTEHLRKKDTEEMFERLSMQNNRYFNAGVMIINYKEWKVQKITKKLLHKMTQLNQKIVFWDQDVLNSLFDGKFLELNDNLNYNLRLTEKNSNKKIAKQVQDEMILIHYSGSFKPWTVRGAYNVNSYYYHNVFKEINGKAYHIVSKWRLGSLKQFIKGILKLNIIFIKRPLSFIKYALLSIFIDDRPL